MRRHLASFALAAALGMPMLVAGSIAAAPIASANNCTVTAYLTPSGTTIFDQGYISCVPAVTDFTLITHLQICTAQLLGNCLTWADVDAKTDRTVCSSFYYFWGTTRSYTAQHQHLYKVAVDGYYNGWTYVRTSYSGNFWLA